MKTKEKNLEKLIKSKEFSWIKKMQKKFPKAEIFLVGGAVRDLLIGRPTKDYDFVVRGIEAKKLESFLENCGKVSLVGQVFGVFKFRPKEFKKNKQGRYPFEDFDIALPRTEHSLGTGGYKDFEVQSDPNLKIEDDLSRRDFTINAIALKIVIQNSKFKIQTFDPFAGQKDLVKKIIRTVGKPKKRFAEDYTRMLRAARFASELGFAIEKNTLLAIKENASGLKKISAERIRDEFNKIIMSSGAEEGMMILYESNLLRQFLPELEKGVGVGQNRSHVFTVFEHSVKSLGYAALRGYNLNVRLAALFHDIAKPQTKRGEGFTSTFFNHDIVGAKFTKKIMQRLKYPKERIDKVSHLVRHHMFYYSMGEVSDAGVRRLLSRVGKENINELIQLRICDRLGMGRPKAKPYKLQTLERKLQEVQMDPITTSMLKIDGHDIMKKFNIKPGPRIGFILNALLKEVLEDPKKNTKKYLTEQAKELNKLTDEELKILKPDISKYEKERKKEFFKRYKEVE